MTTGREKIIRAGALLLCCAILIAGSVMVLNQKEAFFLDEYSSYGCANGLNGKVIDFENNKTYTADEIRQMVLDAYAVSENSRFRFDNVWKNLGNNVHPPVFYAALHFVCSLTPGVFSIWQAGAVNIFFGLISLIFFQKFARALIRSEWGAAALCLCWACTLGLFGNIVFLRDYAAAMCACLIATWEIYRFLHGNRKPKDLVKIGLAEAFCALSHYYCLIYLFFLCGVLCVILMAQKAWKAIAGIAAAAAGAAAVSLAVFPAMIGRILSSNRGTEATENLLETDLSGFQTRLGVYLDNLNRNYFGGLLPWAAGLAVLSAAAWLILRGKRQNRETEDSGIVMQGTDVWLLLIPSVCYSLMVIKIAPYTNLRYLYPVTPALYLAVFAGLTWFTRRLLKPRALIIAVAAVMAVMSGLSWQRGNINYLYKGKRQTIATALEPYRGKDALLIWDGSKAFVSTTYEQLEYFDSAAFFFKISEEQMENLPLLGEGKDAIVFIGKNYEKEGYAGKLTEIYPGYTATALPDIDGSGKQYYHYWFHKE